MSLGIDDLNTFIKRRNVVEESLETKIIGRDREIKEICKILGETNYVVLVGPSGVGKSRLAVEAIEEFYRFNTNYNILCTKYFSDYINDLDSTLDDSKNYILFIDDASSYSKLKELLDYLRYRNNGRIKTVLTVRDYLRNCFNDIDNNDLVYFEVKPLDNKQIKDAIISNTIIRNDKWLDQIVRIANGNIRVAYIAAHEALKDDNDFKSLFNQKELLGKFYKQEISKIDESNSLIITAGIVAFFRCVYLEQLFYISPILRNVGLSKQSFVNNVNILISKEIIDDYKNVVKISDQCFADYLLNYVIVEKEYLKIKDILLVGFKYYDEHVIKSLGTIINVYYNDDFVNHLKETLIEVCDSLESDVTLKRKIEIVFSGIIPEYVLNDYKKEIIEYSDKRDIKWLLGIFYHLANSNYAEVVLEGAFKLLSKTKTKSDVIFKMFTTVFAFDFESTENGFKYLSLFVDYINKYSIFNEQMYSLISSYLKYSFSYSRWNGKKEYVHYNFNINDNMKNIIEFRNKCWNYIFNYDDEKITDVVIDFAKYHIVENCFEIIKNDLMTLKTFLAKSTNKEILQSILYVELYDDLKNINIDILIGKESKYISLLDIVFERKTPLENRYEYNDRYKNDVLNFYTKNKIYLYNILSEVSPILAKSKYYGSVFDKFVEALIDCLDFYQVDLINYFIVNADYPYHLVENVVRISNTDEIYKLISDISDLALKDEYLYFFYKYISVNNIQKTYDFSNWLKMKYDAETKRSYRRAAADLKNIASLSGISYEALVKNFYNKKKYNPFIAKNYLSYLFYEDNSFKELLDLNQKLAIEIYEFLVESKEHDYNLKCLSEILKVKKNYCKIVARNYLDDKIEIDDNEALLFNEEYCEIFFNECMNICVEKYKYYPPFSVSKMINNNITKQSLLSCIEKYIDENYRNDIAMEALFGILSQVQFRYKNEFLLQYYKKGKNPEILRCAILNKTHTYGDAATYFNLEIRELESLKEAFLKWDYIELASFLDVVINDYKDNIKHDEISRLVDYDNREIIEELKKLDYKTEISTEDAFDLYVKDELFRKIIDFGYATYKDGNFVNSKFEPLKFVDFLDKKKILHIKVKTDSSFEDYFSAMKFISDKFDEKDNATLDDILVSLFKKNKWSAKDFMDNTYLEKDTFSKINHNKKNKMEKKTLVQILIGLKLSKPQRDHLLLMNGTPLTTTNVYDALYSFILASQMDVETADELLEKLKKERFSKKYR